MNFSEVLLGATALLFSIALVPQTMQVLKTSNTKVLSLPCFVLLALALLAFTAYGAVTRNLFVIVAGAVGVTLASVILLCKLRNRD